MDTRYVYDSPSSDEPPSPVLPCCYSHQTKITDHFASVGPLNSIIQFPHAPTRVPRVTFLDLPQKVRERVYDLANVGGGKFVDLNNWTIKATRRKDQCGKPMVRALDLSRHLDQQRCCEMAFPAELLWTGSRLLHVEVEVKLYAENAFAVSLLGLNGLRPLEMLSDVALRELRMLIISLCPCKCRTPFCYKTEWSWDKTIWPRPRKHFFWAAVGNHLRNIEHRRPLGCTKEADKLTLSRWQRICSRLASNVRPDQLELYLAADFEDLETVNTFLEPLQALPVLKDAAMSLGDDLKDAEFRSLARNTALGLMNKLQAGSFRFLDLPVELQIKILQHNVSSPRIVTWHPSQGLGIILSTDWCSRHRLKHETILIDRFLFCSAKHPSAFISGCRCLDSPLGYFLVSKAFAAVARPLFYSSNEFIMVPSRGCDTDMIAGLETEDEDGKYQITLLSFLRRMLDSDISSLKHLTVVFPPISPTYLLPDQTGWEEWVQAVEILARVADLPRLKLEVHFSDQYPAPYELLEGEEDTIHYQFLEARNERNQQLEATMLETHRRILAPLKRLGPRLRALLIYIAWPLYWKALKDRKADESMLERMIMGEDYDSRRWGKVERSVYSQLHG